MQELVVEDPPVERGVVGEAPLAVGEQLVDLVGVGLGESRLGPQVRVAQLMLSICLEVDPEYRLELPVVPFLDHSLAVHARDADGHRLGHLPGVDALEPDVGLHVDEVRGVGLDDLLLSVFAKL